MKSLVFSIVAMAVLSAANVVQANYVIDDFQAEQSHIRFNTTPGTTTVTNEVVNGNMFSGQRSVSWSGTTTNRTALSSIAIGDGVLDISNSSLAHSTTSIVWTSPLVEPDGLDLTQGGLNDTFFLEYLSDNVGAPASEQLVMTVTVTDTSGNASYEVIPVSATDPNWKELYIAFSLFSGIDFSSIKSIKLDVLAPLNRDITIRFLDARVSAPEPTSMALAGFAGIGMAVGAIRRRRQAKQAA